MSWLLDTNVISEVRKRERVHPGVRDWWDRTPEEAMFTSVLVLGEIRRAIESARQSDRTKALAIEQWLMRMTETFGDRVLPIDMRVADRWGVLNVPGQLHVIDGLLAATALVHGLTLVTRNIRHVERTGVSILDPFQPSGPP